MINDCQNTRLDTLRRVSATLLDSCLPASSLRPEVLELVETLQSSAKERFTEGKEIALGETHTPGGLALSPTMAAMCAGDYVRTITFIRGLRAAIVDVQRQDLDRPVRVLYAGCGPFGTLAVPLMGVFDSSEVVFTLLDIHPEAVLSVTAVLKDLNLEQSVSNVSVEDALSYRIDPEQLPDVIVTETMQACLDAEPQVSITRHLLEQAPDAVLVPEEVSVDFRLVDSSREFNFSDAEGGQGTLHRDRISLGEVFVVNKETVNSWSNIHRDELPAATILMPELWDTRYQPMLFTSIHVYQDHSLMEYDSGLTCPKAFTLDDPVSSGDELHFSYVLGSNPHLRWEKVISLVQGA